MELPSLPTGHPPPAVLPPTQFADPAGLPPWLKDPSPPGFHISPVQQPPAFDWDRADPPSAPLPQPAAVAPDGSSSWLPEIGHDLSEAGEKTFEWLVIAGVLAGGVLGVGGQRREVPAP